MSISQLKSDLTARTGQNLMPENLPIESLIFMARKLTYLNNGSLSYEEKSELSEFLLFYVKKLMSTKKQSDYDQFKKNNPNLLGLLIGDIDSAIRDALVSRLIGCEYNRISLDEIFIDHLKNG